MRSTGTLVLLLLLFTINPFNREKVDANFYNSYANYAFSIPEVDIISKEIAEYPITFQDGNFSWDTSVAGYDNIGTFASLPINESMTIVVAAHNNGLFENLSATVVGDIVFLNTDQVSGTYEIISIESIPNYDMSYMSPHQEGVDLVMFTCDGSLIDGDFSHRLVVKAIQITTTEPTDNDRTPNWLASLLNW